MREIMGISGAGRIAPADPAGRAAARGGGFSIMPDAPAPAPDGPGAAAPMARAAPVGVSLMLALQETMTSEAGDREARRHGQELLAALADLQRALLSGEGGDALGRLLSLVEATPQAADPGLACAINSIRLRARIELARTAAAADRIRRSVP